MQSLLSWSEAKESEIILFYDGFLFQSFNDTGNETRYLLKNLEKSLKHETRSIVTVPVSMAVVHKYD